MEALEQTTTPCNVMSVPLHHTAYRCEVWHCSIRFLDPDFVPFCAVRCSRCKHANPDHKKARAYWLRHRHDRKAVSPRCGFRAFGGMMPPCVLRTGHAGDHEDGFGGHYGAGPDSGFCIEVGKAVSP